jgi:nucleoside 2-deoxyribosyltransferase
MNTKPFLYLAAPLFSVAERRFNDDIAARLGPYFTVYLPQRDGGLFIELVRNGGHSPESAARHIFALDLKALNTANVLLAILDGRTVDEGVAIEIGYAFGIGKPCFGLQTDPRRLLPEGNNPMVTGAIRRISFGLENLESMISEMQDAAKLAYSSSP